MERSGASHRVRDNSASFDRERQENHILDRMSLGERALINQFKKRLSGSSSKLMTNQQSSYRSGHESNRMPLEESTSGFLNIS